MTPLEVAVSQLGIRRGRTPEDDARIHAYLGGDPRERDVDLDYCAALMLWCFARADQRIEVNFWRARACWYLQHALERMGWRVRGAPRPGDLFFFSRAGRAASNRNAVFLDRGEPGHVGMLWRPTPSGFASVEGNIRARIGQKIHRHAVASREFTAPYRFIRAFYRRPLVRTTLLAA